MGKPIAKRYYEFWMHNCKYCKSDGKCKGQDVRKNVKKNGKCENFKEAE